MASTLLNGRRDLLLGSGAAGGSLLVGLVLTGFLITDTIDLLSAVPVVAALLGCGFLYGIGGLYDIVALGIPKRGVAHLTTGAGIVLALLAPFGSPAQGFVVTAALALFVSAGYHAALVANVLSATEEPAADLESEGDVT